MYHSPFPAILKQHCPVPPIIQANMGEEEMVLRHLRGHGLRYNRSGATKGAKAAPFWLSQWGMLALIRFVAVPIHCIHDVWCFLLQPVSWDMKWWIRDIFTYCLTWPGQMDRWGGTISFKFERETEGITGPKKIPGTFSSFLNLLPSFSCSFAVTEVTSHYSD